MSAVRAQPLTSATFRFAKLLLPLTSGTPPDILANNPAGLFIETMLRENSMKRGLCPLVCVYVIHPWNQPPAAPTPTAPSDQQFAHLVSVMKFRYTRIVNTSCDICTKATQLKAVNRPTNLRIRWVVNIHRQDDFWFAQSRHGSWYWRFVRIDIASRILIFTKENCQ